MQWHLYTTVSGWRVLVDTLSVSLFLLLKQATYCNSIMDGTGHEERVAQTGVGQWSGWNINSKENEEKVLETADGQSSCSAELPNSIANRGRSRVKDLSNWKCQTQKKLRNLGLAYVSCSGMVQRQKK